MCQLFHARIDQIVIGQSQIIEQGPEGLGPKISDFSLCRFVTHLRVAQFVGDLPVAAPELLANRARTA